MSALRRPALVAALLAPGLLLLGVLIGARPALHQSALWLGLQFASLSGAGLGLVVSATWHAGALAARGRGAFVWLALIALLAWRVGYFPIMVFSGHAASVGEWLALAVGLPALVYPTFLLKVFALHIFWAALLTHSALPLLLGARANAAAPSRVQRGVRAGGALAFALAACVSFGQPRDLLPLPDTAWTIKAPAPAPVFEQPNPYRPALFASGYWPHQRVVLLAAALTFETIPPAPWATAVKLTLVDSFRAKPHGAAHDRVREHYHAYHNAHRFLGCRALASCAGVARADARCTRAAQWVCAGAHADAR